MGRARGGAGRGRRTPADRRAPSSGPRWRARWPRRRTGPLRERGLRTSSASGKPSMPGFANPLPPNLDPPRFRRRLLRRLRAAVSLGPIGLFELGGAEAAKRRMRPRPVVDCLDAPEQVRRGLLARGAGASAPASRCPCAAGARFPPGRSNGAGESGRTRKGRRPAPTPPNETNRLQGRRARASRPQRPRAIAPRGPSFPSREANHDHPHSGWFALRV